MKRYKLLLGVAIVAFCSFLALRSCGDGGLALPESEIGYRLNDSLRNSVSDLPSTAQMERHIRNWMARNNIRGASLAVMKDERLIYCKGFGWADKEREREAEVGDIYRIASASKLITAIGIMKLCDEGRLTLDAKVFGEAGILNDPHLLDIKDKRAADITVRQLLNHTSGFSRRLGDPMFRITDIMRWEKMDASPTADQLIAFQLRQREAADFPDAIRRPVYPFVMAYHHIPVSGELDIQFDSRQALNCSRFFKCQYRIFGIHLAASPVRPYFHELTPLLRL